MPRGVRSGAVPCAASGCDHNAYPPKKFCTKSHAYLNNTAASTGGGKVAKTRAPKKVAVPSTPATVARSIVSLPPVAVTPSCTVAITGSITPAGADKFWSILSLEQKAQIIQASLRTILTAEEA